MIQLETILRCDSASNNRLADSNGHANRSCLISCHPPTTKETQTGGGPGSRQYYLETTQDLQKGETESHHSSPTSSTIPFPEI
jgi:hypothetical protein